MKRKASSFIMVSLAVMLFARSLHAQTVSRAEEGYWLTGDGSAIVEISITRGVLSGTVRWLREPCNEEGKPVLDKYNKNPSLRNRPLLGLEIISDLKLSDGVWKDGFFYDPTDGGQYSCRIWLDDTGNLRVRGYLGFIYETEIWTRSDI